MKEKDYRYIKQYAIEKRMEWNDYEMEIGKRYQLGMSAPQIAEVINKQTGDNIISARSIQRRLKKLGIIRNQGDAYRLAVSQGRIKWVYKSDKIKRKTIKKRLRYQILERDNFRCVLCGANGKTAVLEVDHIIPIQQGQNDDPSNLQTLCHECNHGKYLASL